MKSTFLPMVAFMAFLPMSLNGAPTPKEAKADAAKADLSKLEGTWKVVSYQKDGVERDADDLAAMGAVTFKGRNYTWNDEETSSGTIDDLDPTQSPNRITYKPSQAENDEKKVRREYGIYLLAGDVFTDCFVLTVEKDRPTEFVSKPKSGVTLVVYKRVKKKAVSN